MSCLETSAKWPRGLSYFVHSAADRSLCSSSLRLHGGTHLALYSSMIGMASASESANPWTSVAGRKPRPLAEGARRR